MSVIITFAPELIELAALFAPHLSVRDSKQSKVYAAENKWERLSREDGLPDPRRVLKQDEAIEILEAVTAEWNARKGTTKRRPRLVFDAEPFRGSGAYYNWGTIYVPRTTKVLTVSLLLHELAHHLDNRSGGCRSHGGSFIETEVELVRIQLGDESADRLLGVFKGNGFKELTREQELAHVAKVQERAAKRERNEPESGDLREAWIVRHITQDEDNRLHINYEVNQSNSYTMYADNAQIFLTESGARRRFEKVAKVWKESETPIIRKRFDTFVIRWTEVTPVIARWKTSYYGAGKWVLDTVDQPELQDWDLVEIAS